MSTVHCMFGSAVQEKAEPVMPEWCVPECWKIRTSHECCDRLEKIGIDPAVRATEEEPTR